MCSGRDRRAQGAATPALQPHAPTQRTQHTHLGIKLLALRVVADKALVAVRDVEAAVQRALDAHEGTGPDARVAELHALAVDTAQRTRALAADVRADRVSRIEDLEVVVDLLAEGLGAVRGDVARLEARSVRIEKELERVTWALDRVGTQLERFADDVTPPPAS